MADPVEERFEDLGQYYPGSKQKRREPAQRLAEIRRDEEELRWDAKPRYYKVDGEMVEFFTVGHLAQALGKASVTIRLWERKGWLPPAEFRTPARGGVEGQRLYTRAQIEGIIEIAREEGILDTDRPPAFHLSQFPGKVHALFRRLAQ